MSNLKQFYKEQVVETLKKELGVNNPMEIPRITKITLNMGLGEAVADKKIMTSAVKDLSMIAGQKAIVRKARKSEAGFKIREGWPIGAKVTLRKDRMWDFLDRLVSIAIPRIRDFRGLNPKSFDKQGNYSMGLTEQIVFPEIKIDEMDATRGLDITITTTARTKEEGLALMRAMKFPLKGEKSVQGEGN